MIRYYRFIYIAYVFEFIAKIVAQSKRWLLFLPWRWEFHDRLTIALQLMRSGYNVAVKLDRSQ